MPKEPEVLAGTRGPRTERIDAMREVGEREAEPPQVGARRFKDGTVYVSRYGRYRIQVTSPADLTDPITGRKTIGRPVVAQFDGGFWVNSERDPKKRAEVDGLLQLNSRFGKFGSGAEFWLLADQESTTKAAKLKAARETLKSLPAEALAAFVREIRQGDAEDHELPNRA